MLCVCVLSVTLSLLSRILRLLQFSRLTPNFDVPKTPPFSPLYLSGNQTPVTPSTLAHPHTTTPQQPECVVDVE